MKVCDFVIPYLSDYLVWFLKAETSMQAFSFLKV
jgi:hypothetical protein